MKTFKVLNDNGDIEVSSFVNPSVKFQDGLYSEVEELCTYNETFNIYDLVSNYEKLQQENKQLSKEIDIWNKKYNNMFDENKQLKDNWNKLKEYIKQEPTSDFYNDKLPFEVIMVKIINKMQELERGVSDEI